MTGRRVEERVTMHSISCSRLEWERIRVCAEREGVSMSTLIVERALSRNPPSKVRNPPRLVLGPEKQRTLLETVKAIAGTVRALEGTDDAPGFAGSLRVLFEIRLDAMTRTGRHGTMVCLLEQVLRDSRAARSRKRSTSAPGSNPPADPAVAAPALGLPGLVGCHDIPHGLPFGFGDARAFQVLPEPRHHAAGCGEIEGVLAFSLRLGLQALPGDTLFQEGCASGGHVRGAAEPCRDHPTPHGSRFLSTAGGLAAAQCAQISHIARILPVLKTIIVAQDGDAAGNRQADTLRSRINSRNPPSSRNAGKTGRP